MDVNATKRLISVAIGLAAGAIIALTPGAASAKDRNHDGIPDRWEKRHGLSLDVNQASRDQDRDSLQNKREFQAGLDPKDSDSDGDGIDDGDEGSGTITAFDTETGSLTINTFAGESVTADVTEDTEIECDNGDDHGDEDDDGVGGDHSGPGHGGDDDDDHSGPGHGGDDDSDDDPAARRDHGDDDDNDESDCSVDDLAVGAIVHEAELEIEHGLVTWDEIELLK